MKPQTGFTLLELLFVLIVAGVLAALAIPNMRTFISNERMVSQANNLLASLNFARAESIKLGGSSALCGSGGGATCVTTICASNDGATCSSTNWANGWVVCDEPSNKTTCKSSDNATLLRAYPALTGGNTLTSNANAAGSGLTSAYFSYANTGMLQVIGATTPATTFVLCDSRGKTYARSLDLQSSGRAAAGTTPGYQIDGATALTSC